MLGSVTSVTFVNRTGGQGLIATHRTHRIGTHETLPHRIAGDLPIGHQVDQVTIPMITKSTR